MYFLLTTRRNIYSSNHWSVMIRWPELTPGPQLFSTIHFLGLPFWSRSTAISVMACDEPLAKVWIRCFLFMPKVVPISEP